MSNCSYSLHYCSPQKHSASWLTSFFSTSVLRQFSFSLQKYLLWLSRIVSTYIFHAAPGFLWRREGHQNIKDSRSCCFSTTGTTTYLPLCSSTALQGLPPICIQVSPFQDISASSLHNYLPWWKKITLYHGENFSRRRQMFCFLPSHSILCQAPTSACSQHLLTISVPLGRQSPLCFSENHLNCWFLLMFSIFPCIFSDGWCSLNSSNGLCSFKELLHKKGKPGTKENLNPGSAHTNQTTVSQT